MNTLYTYILVLSFLMVSTTTKENRILFISGKLKRNRVFLTTRLICITPTTSMDENCGIRVTKRENNFSPRSFVCSKGGSQCADCTTMIVCASGLPSPLETIECRHPTPYCSQNSCQINATSECIIKPPFTCTGVGVFPDFYNCSRYRVCYAEQSDVYAEQSDVFSDELYECPSSYIFNSRLHLCEKGTIQTCGKMDCSRSSGKMILYPLNPAYYTFCLDNREPMMFKCEFEQFQIFNLTAGECRFNCKAKGNFQNPANCQEYYYCNAANVMAELLSCPNKYVFDGIACTPDLSRCQYPPLSNSNQITTTTTSTRGPAPFDPEQ